MKNLTLTINGQSREFAPSQNIGSLADLLGVLDIDQSTVVAEIDGAIIKRSDFADTKIKTGQKIELIKFVGGG